MEGGARTSRRGEGGTPQRGGDGTSRRRPAGAIAVGLAVGLVIVVYGGYGRHWSWVGVNGHTATLWDWLHLVLLPIAAVVLALWLRHRPELDRGLSLAAVGGLAAFVFVVVAGYVIPWAWTGFAGNTLWDWLNLVALPLAVAAIPVLVELRPKWERRQAVALGAVAVGFIAVVLAGYLAPWRWTGFTGNTVWDWLHLLLLPLLVPAIIVPLLRPAVTARWDAAGDAERAEPAAPAERSGAGVSSGS